MSGKKLFDENHKRKLNTIYISYLKKCNKDSSHPTWTDFHSNLTKEDDYFKIFTVKQINNKIIDYRKIHGSELWPNFSQYKESLKNQMHKRLFQRSYDSFVLAIEIYNRINQKSKIEAFCILIINAWELLIKGYLIRSNGEKSIYLKDDDKRTISIGEAINKVYNDKNSPIYKNLEKIVTLRDQATHLLIPEIHSILSRLFQSNVLNFIVEYRRLSELNLIFENQAGLISFVVDDNSISEPIIEKSYGKKSKDLILNFVKDVNLLEKEMKNSQFMIPIEYRLILSKDKNDGDITLSKNADGSSSTKGIIVEVPKDPDLTHPYISTEAIILINSKLFNNKLMPINRYSFAAIVEKENIRKTKSNKHYYKISKPLTHKYSQVFIDMVVTKIIQNHTYLDSCLRIYRQTQAKKRALSKGQI